jgi:hypothetical protein
MRKQPWIGVIATLVGSALFGLASEARADCAVWSDWGQDTTCNGASVGYATVENLTHDEYLVQCGLDGDACGTPNNSASAVWYAGPKCGLEGVRVEFNMLKLNGDTGEYETENFGYNGDELESLGCFDLHHSNSLQRPWRYVLAACRVGYDCD